MSGFREDLERRLLALVPTVDVVLVILATNFAIFTHMVANHAAVPNDLVSKCLGLTELIVIIIVKHETVVAILLAGVEPRSKEFGPVVGALKAADCGIPGPLGNLPFEEGLELGVLILSDPEAEKWCHESIVCDLFGVDG